MIIIRYLQMKILFIKTASRTAYLKTYMVSVYKQLEVLMSKIKNN